MGANITTHHPQTFPVADRGGGGAPLNLPGLRLREFVPLMVTVKPMVKNGAKFSVKTNPKHRAKPNQNGAFPCFSCPGEKAKSKIE